MNPREELSLSYSFHRQLHRLRNPLRTLHLYLTQSIWPVQDRIYQTPRIFSMQRSNPVWAFWRGLYRVLHPTQHLLIGINLVAVVIHAYAQVAQGEALIRTMSWLTQVSLWQMAWHGISDRMQRVYLSQLMCVVSAWVCASVLKTITQFTRSVCCSRVESHYLDRLFARTFQHFSASDSNQLNTSMVRFNISLSQLIQDTVTDIIGPMITLGWATRSLMTYLYHNPGVVSTTYAFLTASLVRPSLMDLWRMGLLIIMYASYTITYHRLILALRILCLRPSALAQAHHVPDQGIMARPFTTEEVFENRKQSVNLYYLRIKSMLSQNKLMQQYDLQRYFMGSSRLALIKALGYRIQYAMILLLDSLTTLKHILDVQLVPIILMQLPLRSGLGVWGFHRLWVVLVLTAYVRPVISNLWSLYLAGFTYTRDAHELCMHAQDIQSQLFPAHPYVPVQVREDAPRRLVFQGVRDRWSSRQSPRRIDLVLNLEDKSPVYVIGPSGGGKSTLVDLSTGHISPAQGRVWHHGAPRIAMISQYPGFISGTLLQNICLAPQSGVQLDSLQQALQSACISDLGPKLSLNLKNDVVPFSGGQRQRINFARFFYRYYSRPEQQPDLLILDESFSAIDNMNRAKIRQNLTNLGIKLMQITHNMDQIPESARVYYVDQQCFIQDTKDNLRRDPRIRVLI